VGDLGTDTAVTPRADGGYTATLRPEWAIWGPNGGYLASVALRAAGLATGRARPASVLVHFLGVAAFHDVTIETTVLRSSRYATSLRVELAQDGRPVLEALVWGVDEPPVALIHDQTVKPDVPPPEHVASFDERMASSGEVAPFPFWANLEHRPVDWAETWPPAEPLGPEQRWWCRFRPTAKFAEPWLDACRLLIPLDTSGWPAATLPHAPRSPLDVMAPTVDLSVRFHRPTDDEWVYCETVSPVGASGLVTATGRAWDRAGRLLASGEQTMLCRPAPPPG